MKLYLHAKSDRGAAFRPNEWWVLAVLFFAIVLLVILAGGRFGRPALSAVVAQAQQVAEHYRSIKPFERDH